LYAAITTETFTRVLPAGRRPAAGLHSFHFARP
jgi:hypothetical protein